MKLKKQYPGESLADKNPSLVSEWHPSKNGSLTPYDVTPGSHKKAWWKCPKGDDHEWKAIVKSRAKGSGCPICKNLKVVRSNCLATLNPSLAKEWHPSKNGSLTPYDVTPGSHKKAWWKCPKGDDHEWEAIVKSRAKGSGCHICSNLKAVNSNCLAIINPELAKEWHPTKNGKLTPFNVTQGSSKKVWWKCPKGDDHVWITSVVKRKIRGCPICTNSKTVDSNSLAIKNPELSKEWHPTKNGKLTPFDIGAGSGKKVWWKCPKGTDHEWKTSIDHRARGRGCPFCNKKTSAPELRIFSELRYFFPSTQNRAIINGFEIDVYIPEIKVGIEYDGEYWHLEKGDLDKNKNNTLDSSIFLIRIREGKLSMISDKDICISRNGFSIDTVKKILKRILASKLISSQKTIKSLELYLTRKDWIASMYFNKLNSEKNHINYKDSLGFLFPRVAKEWHPTNNKPMLPEYFTPYSNKIVWWKCHRGDDHEWKAAIATRSKGIGCPMCSGNRASKSNNLAISNPKLAKEWHPTKNGEFTPYDVTPGSGKKVWWKCPEGDDHEWEARVDHRNKGSGCKICSSRKIVNSNCLATLYPELAKEWHPTKNGQLTPSDVGLHSQKRVWWQNQLGQEWQEQLCYRVSKVRNRIDPDQLKLFEDQE